MSLSIWPFFFFFNKETDQFKPALNLILFQNDDSKSSVKQSGHCSPQFTLSRLLWWWRAAQNMFSGTRCDVSSNHLQIIGHRQIRNIFRFPHNSCSLLVCFCYFKYGERKISILVFTRRATWPMSRSVLTDCGHASSSNNIITVVKFMWLFARCFVWGEPQCHWFRGSCPHCKWCLCPCWWRQKVRGQRLEDAIGATHICMW